MIKKPKIHFFQKDNPTNTLSEVISKAGLSQLHTAETENMLMLHFSLMVELKNLFK